jgi:nucleoside 2-deoxyribosyltransferase
MARGGQSAPMRIYLAGPDVFFPDPQARAADLKAVCARYGAVGVSPLDPLDAEPAEWAHQPEAHRIALRNEAHIKGCDVLIANLTPFRGASADVGTVFELGFMRALGRRVYGWSNDLRPFAERVRFIEGLGRDARTDMEGLVIEDFGLVDNLMIDGAISASGGSLYRADVSPEMWWRDLTAFEGCVAAAADSRLPRSGRSASRR